MLQEPGHTPFKGVDKTRSGRSIIIRPLEPMLHAFAFVQRFLHSWMVAFVHFSKRLLPQVSAAQGQTNALVDDWEDPANQHEEVAFTLAAIALSAKLAMVDGQASDREYAAFMHAFPMPESEEEKIRRLYRSAQKDQAPASFYARHMVTLYPGKRQLFTQVLERLFEVAASDGPVNLAEFRFLREIAKAFSLDDTIVECIGEKMVKVGAQNPYLMLGVPKNCDAITLKRSYHQTLRACHPDRVTASLSHSQDAMEQSWARLMSRQAVAVNAAYKQLQRAH